MGRRYAFETFLLDVDAGELKRDEKTIHLSPKVFLLLVHLIEHAGALVEKAALLEAERAARRGTEIAVQQLQSALRAGRMGTWEYAVGTGAVRWSQGLEEIHGFAPGTFAGTFEAFRDEIHPEDRNRVLDAIQTAVEQQRDHHVEYRIVRADGAVR